MFDIGFTELLLCAVVGLLVIGPERLPGAARTAGRWVAHLRRSFAAVKAEVEREIGADELRLQLHNDRILEEERERNARQQQSFDAQAHNQRILDEEKRKAEIAAPASAESASQPAAPAAGAGVDKPADTGPRST